MRGWQANERHTCVLPVVLGLCPKLKYPLLCRGIIIYIESSSNSRSFINFMRLEVPVLSRMLVMCFLTVAISMDKSWLISLLDAPSFTRLETSISRQVKP